MHQEDLEKLQEEAALLAQRAAVYSTGMVLPDSKDTDEDVGEVEKELREECEMLAQETLNIQSKLESRLASEPPKGTQNEVPNDVLQAVYKAKERRLQGEIDALKYKNIEVVSTHPDYLAVMVKHQMSETIAQLEQTLSSIRTERKKVAEMFEREKAYFDQQKDTELSLLKEIQHLNEARQREGADDNDLQELQEKRRVAVGRYKNLMRTLGEFVTKHYNLQNRRTKPPIKKSVERSTATQQTRYEPLLSLIEALMNRLFDVPHDPYVQLTDRHWPPYVELLLRCGVASRHPETHDKLRLTPYHL